MKISLSFTSIHRCSRALTQRLWLKIEEERVSREHTHKESVAALFCCRTSVAAVLFTTKVFPTLFFAPYLTLAIHPFPFPFPFPNPTWPPLVAHLPNATKVFVLI